MPIGYNPTWLYELIADQKTEVDGSMTTITFNEGESLFAAQVLELVDSGKKKLEMNHEAKMNARSIPLRFTEIKSSGSTRLLCSPHPKNQVLAANFYDTFYPLIVNWCTKSESSMRTPKSLARRVAIRGTSETTARYKRAQEVEVDGLDYRYFSSYFRYAPCNYIGRVAEVPRVMAAASKFPFLVRADVRNCFGALYTHSISWATRGRELSKRYLTHSTFDSAFDNLMSDMNFGETHGIIVGPEISRLFAEIILQKVDLDLKAELAKRSLSSQVEFFRYVDDYFLYAKEEKVASDALDSLTTCLSRFNMELKSEKTRQYSTLASLKENRIARLTFAIASEAVQHATSSRKPSKSFSAKNQLADLCADYPDSEYFIHRRFLISVEICLERVIHEQGNSQDRLFHILAEPVRELLSLATRCVINYPLASAGFRYCRILLSVYDLARKTDIPEAILESRSCICICIRDAISEISINAPYAAFLPSLFDCLLEIDKIRDVDLSVIHNLTSSFDYNTAVDGPTQSLQMISLLRVITSHHLQLRARLGSTPLSLEIKAHADFIVKKLSLRLAVLDKHNYVKIAERVLIRYSLLTCPLLRDTCSWKVNRSTILGDLNNKKNVSCLTSKFDSAQWVSPMKWDGLDLRMELLAKRMTEVY